MEAKDISLMIGNVGFNYRVAAVIEYDNKILLHKSNNFDFWNLPGGRVKTNEPSEKALTRELEEELGYKFEYFKFIHLAENFFTWEGRDAHELLFVYKIILSDKDELAHMQDFKALDNDKLTYRWFDKSEIKNIKCLPNLIYYFAKKDDNGFLHTYGG
jgi:ADP-ribose pyrophosphatase YjhB (NUDIX family)